MSEKTAYFVCLKRVDVKMAESEILIYTNKEGDIKVDVRLEEETVWLTQDQMAMLFGKAKSTINEHIQNIYIENELDEFSSMRKFGNSEFSTKPTNFYNLDVIISVGYRVKSVQGTQFRIWATQNIEESEQTKRLIVKYLSKEIIEEADKIWDEKSWTNETIVEFLNMHERTSYNPYN